MELAQATELTGDTEAEAQSPAQLEAAATTPGEQAEAHAPTPAQVVQLAPPPREDTAGAPKRLPPAHGHRLAPAREPTKPTQKEEDKQEDAAEHGAQKGPSRDQRRRFTERMKEADSPEKVREALLYGVKIGRISTEDMRAALEGEAPPKKPEAASPAAPAQAATAAGVPPPAANPAAPPPPAEKLIMGQPAKAVQAAAKKVHFVTAQFAAMGLASGWGSAKPEPMKLFEGTDFEFESDGDPYTRLVELGSVELARMQGGSGGDSALSRRMELGMLALAAFGPGLAGPVQRAAGAVGSRLARVVSVIGGQVKRWRK